MALNIGLSLPHYATAQNASWHSTRGIDVDSHQIPTSNKALEQHLDGPEHLSFSIPQNNVLHYTEGGALKSRANRNLLLARHFAW